MCNALYSFLFRPPITMALTALETFTLELLSEFNLSSRLDNISFRLEWKCTLITILNGVDSFYRLNSLNFSFPFAKKKDLQYKLNFFLCILKRYWLKCRSIFLCDMLSDARTFLLFLERRELKIIGLCWTAEKHRFIFH